MRKGNLLSCLLKAGRAFQKFRPNYQRQYNQSYPGFESLFADGLCLFANQFEQFFMQFENQNFPSGRVFVLRKTTKFLITRQVRQFAYILLQKVINSTLFSCIWMAFWHQTPNEGACSAPPYP